MTAQSYGTASNKLMLNVRSYGAGQPGTPLVCLHPIPHDGEFFGTALTLLAKHRPVLAPDYPGYGLSTALDSTPTITAYADALADTLLLNREEATATHQQVHLLGFHTGCLIAAELALRYPDRISQIVLIDIPLFSAERSAELLSSTDATDPGNAGFIAAFEYPCAERFQAVNHAGLIVATQSSLLEPTRAAAPLLSSMTLVERMDITRPAFETGAAQIAELVGGFLRR